MALPRPRGVCRNLKPILQSFRNSKRWGEPKKRRRVFIRTTSWMERSIYRYIFGAPTWA